MPGEILLPLAQWAGQTVAAAAVTDVWESARRKIAGLFGRGDPRKTELAERWLTGTHEQLMAAQGGELEQAQAAQAQRWQGRFADLLDEDPVFENDLRALVAEIRAELPAGVVFSGDHSVAAGGDMAISASTGGVAGGVIHGGVSTGNPPSPDPGKGGPDPGPR